MALKDRSPYRLSLWVLLSSLMVMVSAVADDTGTKTYASNFMFQQEAGNQCLDLKILDGEKVFCDYEDPDVVGLCYPRNRVVFSDCNESKQSQRWRFNFVTMNVYYESYSNAMCLSRMVETLEMSPCTDQTVTQQWGFDQNKSLYSLADKEGELTYLSLLSPEGFTKAPPTFRFVESEMGEEECYLNPLTGTVECQNSQEPDESGDGKKKKPAPIYDWDESENFHWVSAKLTDDLELQYGSLDVCLMIKNKPACDQQLNPNQCYGGAEVVADYCHTEGNSYWRHDLRSKRMFNRMTGFQYCLSWLQGKLTMQPCFSGGSPAQKWYFAAGNNYVSLERGRLRSMAQGSRDPYAYMQVLTMPYDPDESSLPDKKKNKKQKPKKEEVRFAYPYEICGFNPVTGDWQGNCPERGP